MLFLNPEADSGSSLEYYKLLYNIDCSSDSMMHLRGLDKHEAKEYAYPIGAFSIWFSCLYNDLTRSPSEGEATYVVISPLTSTSAIHGLLESISLAKIPSPRVVYQPFCSILGVWEHVQDVSRIVVIDLGANYFTTSFVANENNSLSIVDTANEFLFGGHDIDNTLAMQARDRYRRYNWYVDPSSENYCQLLLAAEKAKKVLSERDSAEIEIENSPCSITITREQFSRMIEYPMKQMLGFVHRHVRNLQWDNSSFCILVVGGNARSREIIRFIQDEFPRNKMIIPDDVESCTVRGLSIAGTIERYRANEISPEYPSVQLTHTLLHSLAIRYEGREEIILEKGQPLRSVTKKVEVQHLKENQLTLVEVMDRSVQPVWTIDLDTDQKEVALEILFSDNFQPCPFVDGKPVKPRFSCSLNKDERKKVSGALALQRSVSKAKSFFQLPSSPLREETLQYLQSIEEKLPTLLFQSSSASRVQYVKTVHSQLEEYLQTLFGNHRKPYLFSVCSHK